VAWSDLTDHTHFADVNDITTRNRWSADIAARAGIAVDRALVYAKAGLAAGEFAFSFANAVPDAGNGSATLAGLLFGAGVEYAVAPSWSVKLEYNHIDYFGRNVGFNDTINGPFLQSEAATANVVKLGANYQFSDVPFAAAANRAATTSAIIKAPAYKAPVAANYWTGCYAGVHGGGVLADSFTHGFVAPGVSSPGIGNNDTNTVPLSSGGFAGGQLGCDYQTGALVVGLQGEAAWSRLINHFNSTVERDDSTNLVWSADGAARAGVAIDRGLIYGKAGVAAGRFEFSGTEFFPAVFEHGSTALTGLLLGGGIEYALAPNWSVLLEYNRIAYAGRVVHFVTPFDQTVSATANEVKAGVNYRFGGATLPPVRGGSQNLLPPPATDWTGCYAGVHAGGGIVDDAFVLPIFIGDESSSGGGALAGAQTGCNVQTGIMVFGLEGEAAWSNLTNRFFNQHTVLISEGGAIATAGAPTSPRAPASPSTARSSTAKPAWRLGGSVFLRAIA
jgi:opacity protein-like surface antigen